MKVNPPVVQSEGVNEDEPNDAGFRLEHGSLDIFVYGLWDYVWKVEVAYGKVVVSSLIIVAFVPRLRKATIVPM